MNLHLGHAAAVHAAPKGLMRGRRRYAGAAVWTSPRPARRRGHGPPGSLAPTLVRRDQGRCAAERGARHPDRARHRRDAPRPYREFDGSGRGGVAAASRRSSACSARPRRGGGRALPGLPARPPARGSRDAPRPHRPVRQEGDLAAFQRPLLPCKNCRAVLCVITGGLTPSACRGCGPNGRFDA